MRIIIAGSREFNDYDLLLNSCLKIINQLKDDGYNTTRGLVEIVSGNARGADKLGERFAEQFNLKVKRFIPDWNGLGKRAGYVRNGDMAKYAKEDEEIGVLIAFWNGSKGTKHMIDLANKEGLKVFIEKF